MPLGTTVSGFFGDADAPPFGPGTSGRAPQRGVIEFCVGCCQGVRVAEAAQIWSENVLWHPHGRFNAPHLAAFSFLFLEG